MQSNNGDLFASPNDESKKSQPSGATNQNVALPVSLDSPGVAKALSKQIKSDIDDYCIRTYDGGHRWHLGASLIGDECARKLWYIYRWCFLETADTPADHARKQRLFNRGHREEARFTEWIRGIGCELHTHDTSKPVGADGEYPQFRVSAVDGHFGGSLDGIVKLPARYRIDDYMLAEFKTNGTGAGFNKLLEKGMPLSKPQHFAQTSTYGSDPAYAFKYVAYFNINKNDDDMHIEIVKLDWNLGDRMRDKAERIIKSQTPPERIAPNPTFMACRFCGASDICHKGAIPMRNCRSCVNAIPVEQGEWGCLVHNAVIPRNVVPEGCPSYRPITANA